MIVGKVNLQKYSTIENGMEAVTKVRYKDAGTKCHLFNMEGGKIRVEFDAAVKAIAPGQSAVFYEGNDVIGGELSILLRNSMYKSKETGFHCPLL